METICLIVVLIVQMVQIVILWQILNRLDFSKEDKQLKGAVEKAQDELKHFPPQN